MDQQSAFCFFLEDAIVAFINYIAIYAHQKLPQRDETMTARSTIIHGRGKYLMTVSDLKEIKPGYSQPPTISH